MRRVLGHLTIGLGFTLWFVVFFLATRFGGQLLPEPLEFLAWPVVGLSLLLFVPVVRLPFRLGMGLAARRAAEVGADDARPKVLLLRSFADDHLPVPTMSPVTRFVFLRYFVWDYTTLEELLVRVFARCGPVVAVGRPGERFPPFGAAREWLADDVWQKHVEDLVWECRAVVVVVGDLGEWRAPTGLGWEVRRLAERGVLRKTFFVLPPLPDEALRERWDDLARQARCVLPPPRGGELGVVFAADGSPVVLRGRRRRERDYLWALLPHAARYYAPRRTAAARALSALTPVLPRGQRDLIDPWLYSWLLIVFLAAGAHLAAVAADAGAWWAGFWFALFAAELGWVVATFEEWKLHHGDGGWHAVGFAPPPPAAAAPPPGPDPRAVLDRLAAVFPGFRAAWDGPGNVFREADATLATAGVFSAFGPYFRDHYAEFTPDQLATLGRVVGQCVASDSRGAVVACFFPNVAAEACGADFRRFLPAAAVPLYDAAG